MFLVCHARVGCGRFGGELAVRVDFRERSTWAAAISKGEAWLRTLGVAPAKVDVSGLAIYFQQKDAHSWVAWGRFIAHAE